MAEPVDLLACCTQSTRAVVQAELPEAERMDLIRVTTRLRERLGDERFEAEFARGRAERVAHRGRNEPVTAP